MRIRSLNWCVLLSISTPAASAAYATKPTLTNPASVKLGETKPEVPLRDVLVDLPSPPSEIQGTLVYLERPVSSPSKFLVLRGITNAKMSLLTSHSFNSVGEAFNPQFSPDARFVLFSAGNLGDRYNSHYLYLWDRLKKNVLLGPPQPISYLRTFWAPDSRHLAYVIGGDIEGNEDQYTNPIQLFVYDVWTHKNRRIAQSSSLTHIGWIQKNTLLYSAFASVTHSLKPKPHDATNRPDIYEVSAFGGKPRLIFKDGFRPLPSPDGKWIACFTSTDPNANQNTKIPFSAISPSRSWLCLFNRAENKRYGIRSEEKRYSELRWTPDSKNLVVVTTVATKPAKAQIELVDVTTRAIHPLTSLESIGTDAGSRVETQPVFEVKSISNDGRFLFVVIQNAAPNQNPDSVLVQLTNTLQAIDLQSGAVATLTRFNGDSGLDWHDESVAPAPTIP